MTVPNLLQLITKTLTASSNITDLVGMRVYPQALALVRNPSFPCVTIHYEGGTQAGNMRLGRVDELLIQAWSKENYTKCWDLYEEISILLSEQRLNDTNFNVFLYESMGALSDLDDSGKEPIYSISCKFTVYNARR